MVGELLDGEIRQCINYGTLEGDTKYKGGIVGYIIRGTVSQCVNKGEYHNYNMSHDSGGICGQISNARYSRDTYSKLL